MRQNLGIGCGNSTVVCDLNRVIGVRTTGNCGTRRFFGNSDFQIRKFRRQGGNCRSRRIVSLAAISETQLHFNISPGKTVGGHIEDKANGRIRADFIGHKTIPVVKRE